MNIYVTFIPFVLDYEYRWNESVNARLSTITITSGAADGKVRGFYCGHGLRNLPRSSYISILQARPCGLRATSKVIEHSTL